MRAKVGSRWASETGSLLPKDSAPRWYPGWPMPGGSDDNDPGDDLRIDSPELTLPHPRMHERAFVLAPLCDIDHELLHPVLGVPVRELLAKCAREENLIRRTEYSI